MSIISGPTDRGDVSSVIARNEHIVKDAYRKYQAAGVVDPEIFNQATLAFNQLERIDRDRRNASPESLPSEQFIVAKRCIEAMHCASPNFTLRDLQMLQSFMQRSPEKYYVAPNGVKYYQPDDSHLLQLGGDFFSPENYRGMGLNKHLLLPHPTTKERCPCSMLWLQKKPDQIAFEREQRGDRPQKPWWNPFPSYDREVVEARIDWQKEMLSRLNLKLRKLTREWDYDCYQVCAGSQLLNFGMSLQDADELHAVFLFYKKCDADVPSARRAEPKPLMEPIVTEQAAPAESGVSKTLWTMLILRIVAAVHQFFFSVYDAIYWFASNLWFCSTQSFGRGVP